MFIEKFGFLGVSESQHKKKRITRKGLSFSSYTSFSGRKNLIALRDRGIPNVNEVNIWESPLSRYYNL